MSSKIRVGLIGLSTTSKSTNWGGISHLPYLISPQGKEHYEITAICNTSVEKGRATLDHYKLPSSIKTYASPHDLAADPDIDLIVNVTGVAQHYDVLLPAVQAGKNVFTELPLASNMKQMTELYSTAQEKGVKTCFSMQGQTSPVTEVLRKVIDSGKIGKVLSSTWVGCAAQIGGPGPSPVGNKYFSMRETGGNIMTIFFLHTINHILSTLGELDTFHSMLGNQRPTVQLSDPDQDNKIVDTIEKDTPDQVFLQGRLENGALLSYHLRGGAPFPGQPGLNWTVYGEKGEIHITAATPAIDIFEFGLTMHLHDFSSPKDTPPTELTLPKDAFSDLMQGGSKNVGRIYDAYARGKVLDEKKGWDGYPDWKMAMKRHELIEEMWRRSDRGVEGGAFGMGVSK